MSGSAQPGGRHEGRVPARRAVDARDPAPLEVLAAFVAAGGSVSAAARVVGIRPSTAKRHLADLTTRTSYLSFTPPHALGASLATRGLVPEPGVGASAAALLDGEIGYTERGCPTSDDL